MRSIKRLRSDKREKSLNLTVEVPLLAGARMARRRARKRIVMTMVTMNNPKYLNAKIYRSSNPMLDDIQINRGPKIPCGKMTVRM